MSGIIQYQDEERNAQSVIAMSSENGFYIFRSLSGSYRLRVPDISTSIEEQLLWSQFESEPEKLGAGLEKLERGELSETGKYLLGCETMERKKEVVVW